MLKRNAVMWCASLFLFSIWLPLNALARRDTGYGVGSEDLPVSSAEYMADYCGDALRGHANAYQQCPSHVVDKLQVADKLG